MNYDIAPRPKSVGGITFRSSLEYAWAIYLRNRDIRFLYEPRVFDLSRPYTPDFFLIDSEVWIEIKPFCFWVQAYCEYSDILAELTAVTGQSAYLVCGQPLPGNAYRDMVDLIIYSAQTGCSFRGDDIEVVIAYEKSMVSTCGRAICPVCGHIECVDVICRALINSARRLGVRL